MGYTVTDNKEQQTQAEELSRRTVSMKCCRSLVLQMNNSQFNIFFFLALTALAIHFLKTTRCPFADTFY